MPLKNFHSARLHSPDEYKENPDWSKDNGKFRTTEGKKAVVAGAGMFDFPKNIELIWGQLKTQSGETANVQSLRFPKSDYTKEQAIDFLLKNNIDYMKFEPAKDDPENHDTNPKNKSIELTPFESSVLKKCLDKIEDTTSFDDVVGLFTVNYEDFILSFDRSEFLALKRIIKKL
ncbi:unnamed protein product [marine sediment metagenome]|uniref:Uncharacterized protein n=1 Tax=marine sediment metagenome TaxID=412755 RepID=X0V8X8_9ZZZZ